MTNTQTVRIDLTAPGGFAPVIHAVEGDIYSRLIKMELYQDGTLYEPPSGTTCVIGWRRENAYGAYSKILENDGKSTHEAWQLDGSSLTIELDYNVCRKSGDVAVNVALIGIDGSRLHTWELLCQVARGAVADADDPTKPSESATQAADRAEQAAAEAQNSAAALADAVSRAEAAAHRAEAAAPVEGAVTSVNGKGGSVTLDAYDVGALPSPAAGSIQPGMLLAVKEITADGKIITEAVEPPSDEGFVEMTESLPTSQRRKGTLYGLITHDLSDEDTPATFNN